MTYTTLVFCLYDILKFLSVKAVLFFSFWQQVLVFVLAHFGFIKETLYWSKENVSKGILSFLIDIEMVAIAIVHMCAFSYLEFCQEDKEDLQREVGEDVTPTRLYELTLWAGIQDAFNPKDLVQEVAGGFRHLWALMRGRVYSDLHAVHGKGNKSDEKQASDES
jgi:hypothetical protein